MYGDIATVNACALSLCARTHNVSLSSNQFYTSITETAFGKMNIIDHGRVITEEGELALVNAKNDGFPTSWWTFNDLGINMTYPSTDPMDPSSDSYSSLEGLQAALNAFFNGNMTGSKGPFATPTDIQKQANVSSNTMYALKASSNIPLTMQNVATAMTNYLRDTSTTTATGEAGVNEAYVRIAWRWIVLPATLLSAAIALLLLTMSASKSQGARVWKTSELALFFHPLVNLNLHVNDRIENLSEMKHIASSLKVRINWISDKKDS